MGALFVCIKVASVQTFCRPLARVRGAREEFGILCWREAGDVEVDEGAAKKRLAWA